MPLYVGDYLSDTMTLTTEQHGAYLLLLMAAWKEGGRLDGDDESLAAITRLPIGRWKAMRAKIIRYFDVTEDGFLVQSRVTSELGRAKGNLAARQEAGRKGAEKRWQKDGKRMAEPSETDGKSDGKPMANGMTNRWQTDAPSPSPSPIPISVVKPRALTTPNAELSAVARTFGIECNPSDPRLIALAERGVSAAGIGAACEEAKRSRGNGRVSIGYVVAIIERWLSEGDRLATSPSRTDYDPVAIAMAEENRS